MKKYFALDVAQFIASIMIIFIHCGQIFNNEIMHFLIKTVIARIAVPLFLVSTAYFYRKKSKADKSYHRKYFIRQIKTYLFWSLFYLPYCIHFLIQKHIPLFLTPFALIIALFYTGVCYHLWYFPALFLGLYIAKYLFKISRKITFLIAMTLYTLGSCETYSKILDPNLFRIYTIYKSLFFTTRNGLFYVLPFIIIGFFLADLKPKSLLYKKRKFFLCSSFFLLFIETGFIFFRQGDDKNFLFSLIPLSFFLVMQLLNLKNNIKISRQLRKLGQFIFFIHPLFIEIFKLNLNLIGWQLFLLTALCCLISYIFIQGIKKLPNTSRIIAKSGHLKSKISNISSATNENIQ
ncbi:acyltransferase [Xylocopilactobacillus apis]|uniref:acyltransferase n=1 Tax=Xylocopilactobacillus apis TaxID=2932183 RepID=UPI002954FC18|nr:acyltransferase [Xylocopilactobacillus apis]